jgi:hypothetical protein
MSNDRNYIFKIAAESEEFEQIFRLNYASFVEEIPQHPENGEKILIDKFHGKNTYLICMTEKGQLAGMLCIADQRPFSLDYKINNLDDYIPVGAKCCEIRLLAVDKQFRNSFVFFGLAEALRTYCDDNSYAIAFISGTTRQQKLYAHLGFVPFGELVGNDGAKYQPMYKKSSFIECL